MANPHDAFRARCPLRHRCDPILERLSERDGQVTAFFLDAMIGTRQDETSNGNDNHIGYRRRPG
jgi:hypothetical protein